MGVGRRNGGNGRIGDYVVCRRPELGEERFRRCRVSPFYTDCKTSLIRLKARVSRLPCVWRAE